MSLSSKSGNLRISPSDWALSRFDTGIKIKQDHGFLAGTPLIVPAGFAAEGADLTAILELFSEHPLF
jgi:hypothetical protein